MKAWILTSTAPEPSLVETDIAQPDAQAGEVLVRISAAGITPTEVLWYPTTHATDGSARSGAVLSHEFSGTIAAVGDGVSGVSAGQEVYGMNDWFAQGALAEYCVTRPEWIAPKPRGIGHAEAASVPIGALTAWQGLFDKAKLARGERVLIHGGAGAVGIFAVQLARARGADVTATASAHNLEFVRQLGAHRALDYRSTPFEEEVHDIDVVFDTVGGETLHRSWNVLKPGGRLVTIAADVEYSADERSKAAFFIVEANHLQLVEIARQFETGELRTVLDRVLPFSEALEAYTDKSGRRRRGKLVVSVAGSHRTA